VEQEADLPVAVLEAAVVTAEAATVAPSSAAPAQAEDDAVASEAPVPQQIAASGILMLLLIPSHF
jgi:hypothetical protein